MANMREIRQRINSIKEIYKITNAMYLISSSKLKKVRKSLEATEPYFHKLQTTLDDILVHTPHTKQRYFDRRESIHEDKRKKGYVIMTSDKGLCGSYNHNVIKLAEHEIAKSNNCYLYVLGQVGRMYFRRKYRSNSLKAVLDTDFNYPTQNPTLFTARDIAEFILDKFDSRQLVDGQFTKGEKFLDEVYVIYTEMISSVQLETRILPILPFSRHHFATTPEGKLKKMPKASFLPSPQMVMDYLIPNYVKGLIYGAMVEAFSCEQQSRMTAMNAATTSAQEMLANLSLTYNRARQAVITQEIIELINKA